MNNKFQQSSKLERTKMTALFGLHNITNFSFTDDDGLERHDGEFQNPDNLEESIMFEVKVRNVSSSAYRTTIIEESKYDYLMAFGKKAYLFIFFSDNTYFIHKLDPKNNYKKVSKSAPKTTCGNRTYVQKNFIEIEIDKIGYLTT